MTELSKSLSDLAERIGEANAAVRIAERTSANRALVAGKLLCQAKDDCEHGAGTLFGRAGIHDRQARCLLQLARSRSQSGRGVRLGGHVETWGPFPSSGGCNVPGYLLQPRDGPGWAVCEA